MRRFCKIFFSLFGAFGVLASVQIKFSAEAVNKISESAQFIVNIYPTEPPEMCTCIAHRDSQQILNI